jgi:hypothetical protein
MKSMLELEFVGARIFSVARSKLLISTILLCASAFGAYADTTVTVFFTNSGGAISHLKITDDICNATRVSQFFAANDAKQVDGFCVLDASRLVTDLSIYIDDDNNAKYSLKDVPANSSVEVSTGRVTPP